MLRDRNSVEGEGTTFWFNIVAMAEKPATLDVRLYQGKRCLIADQHQTAKESLQTEVDKLRPWAPPFARNYELNGFNLKCMFNM